MKQKLTLLLFLAFLLGMISLHAATWNIPGDKATLAAAITDLNALGTVGENYTLNLVAGNPQTAPIGGYIITASGTSSYSITIQGNNNTITAYTPQASGTLHDAIFEIDGGDYITIQNFVMQENAANTTTAAGTNNMTEFGVAIFYANATNGAKYITLQNNTISLNRTYQNSFGIFATDRTTSTSVTTTADITAATGAHDYLHIYGNQISNVNIGIVSVGSNTTAYMPYGLDIGGTSSATGNAITNFGTTGSFSSYPNVSGTVNGINLNNHLEFNVQYNTLTSSVGGVSAVTSTLRGMYAALSGTAPSSGNYVRTFSHNSISLKHGNAGGIIHGVYIDNGNAYFTLNISYNDFNNTLWTVAATAAYIGINQTGAAQTATITYNTFTNLSLNTSGSVTLISHAYSMPLATSTQVISNNSIVTALNKTVAGGTVYGTSSSSSSVTGSTATMEYNNFSNITVTGATAVNGIYQNDGGLPTKYIRYNTFTNWTGGTSLLNPILASYNANSEIIGNTINTLSSTGPITAINIGSSGTATLIKIEGHDIYGLTGTGIVQGITSSTPSTVTACNISKNKVHNLQGNGAAGYAYGITASGSYVNIFNNMIYDLRTPDGATSTAPNVAGIRVTSGTTNLIHYNSVYLNTTGSAAAFSTACLHLTGGTTTEIRNNIFVNKCTPGASGRSYAIWKSSTGTTYIGPNSNKNIYYYSPGVMAYNGTTTYATYADWKSALADRDQGSYEEDVPFQNTTREINLHIRDDVTTRVEGNAVSLYPTYDTDFDGDDRNDGTPDIGADEGNFMAVVAAPGVPSNTSPTDTATNVPINTPLVWSANSEGGTPSSYDVFFSQNPDPDFYATVYVSTCNPPKEFGKTYYWKVKAINDEGSETGAVWSFTTANGIPTLTYPGSGATGIPRTFTFTWTAVTGVSQYKIKCGTSSGASDILNMQTTATNSYVLSTPLSYLTPYYWSVFSVNGTQEVQSAEWMFTTMADPTITIPWSENFTGLFTGAIPNNWNRTHTNWGASSTSSAGGTSPEMKFSYSPSATSIFRLSTPPLRGEPSTNYRLNFKYFIDYYATPATYKVQTSLDGNSWTDRWTLVDPVANVGPSSVTVDLTPLTGTTFYIAWVFDGYSFNTDGWFIDNVQVEAIPSILSPSNLTVSNIGSTAADLGWTENNSPAATSWDIKYGTPGFNPETEGTLVSGVTSNPYHIAILSPNTAYDWFVRSVVASKDRAAGYSTWAGPSSFLTTQTPAVLPYSEGFEVSPINWSVINGTQTNKWQVGTATFYAGAKSAYISNDSGTTNFYNTSSTSVVHMYRDIAFSADSQKFDLTFWWKGYGESSSYDYLQVFLVDTSVSPVAGTRLLSGQIGSNYNLQTTWNQASIVIPGTNSGTTKRLVFSWWNDSYGGTQPPIAVDDINLIATPNPTTPVFSLTPSSKSFGDQQIGTSSAAQVFTIKNTGVGTLNITSPITIVDDDAAHFVLTDANSYPYTGLGPDATMTVSVVFHPTTIGAKAARLKIVDDLAAKGLMFVKQSSDGLRSDRYAALTGNGYDSTIGTFPYTQDFEGATFPPSGWTRTDLDGDGTIWTSSTTQNHTPSGSKSAYHAWSSAVPEPGQNGWLITPPIAVPATGKYRVSFWNYNQYPDDYVYAGLLVNTTNNASDPHWVELWSPETVAAAWSYKVNSLSAYAGQTIYLAFNYQGYNADGWYVDDVTLEEYFDYPVGQPVVVGTETITVTGGSANNGTGTIPDIPNASFVTTGSYVFELMGTGPWTITIATTAPWGAYYSGGQWYSVQNVGGFITFTVTGSKDAEVPVVLGDSDPTLPVELSSFTATITTDLCVKIAWIAQTETNHSGYNILRAEANDLTNAIKINPVLIDNGTPLGTQISYSYTDVEAYSNMVYYYWLESIALDGVSEYFGPLSVTIGDPSQPPLPPAIPMFTKLMNAFPNPFNPNTNLRYSLKEAGKVNISIYNVKGQLIKSFQNDHTTPGYYQVSWDGRDMNGQPVSSGIYMYRMTSGKYNEAKKMILAK